MNWRWQDFGAGLMLVTDGGGAKVVLGGGRSMSRTEIVTRGENGVLRPIKATDDVAKLIELAPRMRDLLLVIWDECPEMHGVDELRFILTEVGGKS